MIKVKESTQNFPGAYSFTQEIRKFDFQKQQEDLTCIETEPGPLSYQPNVSVIKTQAPLYSIQNTKKKTYYNQHSYLSPFHYNPLVQQNFQQISFTKQTREQKIEQSNKLGPQFYNPNYLPTKDQILKYSFGYKADQINKNKNPGPGSYFNEEQKTDDKPSLGKDVRLKYKQNNQVGPGDYDPIDMKFFGNPQIQFTKEKRVVQNYFQNPAGPGDYNINRKINLGPQKTIGQKLNVTYDQEQPGPGAYLVKNQYKNLQYSVKRAQRSDMVLNNFTLVAPNSYNPQLQNKKIPVSFVNASHQTEFQKFLDDQKELPGPGNYEQYQYFGKKDCPQFSQGKEKRFIKFTQKLDVPGPGNYYIKKTKQNNIGSFSKAQRMPINKNELYPGPADYNKKVLELHPTPNTAFTKATHKTFIQPHDVSPADYYTEGNIAKIPNYIILRQNKDKQSQSLITDNKSTIEN